MEQRKRIRLCTGWKKRTDNKKGYTLTEVMITMALTLIVTGAALFFLERGLFLYRRIQGASDVIAVSDMAFSRIAGQIKQAGPDSAVEIGGGEDGCQYLVLSGPDGSVGIQVSADEDGLIFTEPSGTEEEWLFASQLPADCRVEGLSFFLYEDEEGRRLQVCLSLHHENTGFSFSSSRFVELGG